jgi:hypothetical protein
MKKFLIFLFVAAFFTASFCHAQTFSSAFKTKVNSEYSWPQATDAHQTFHFVSVDGKRYKFYLAINDFFVPIETAPRNSLGIVYVIPKSKTIKLYERKVEDEKEIFNPVATIETNSTADFIAGIFPSGEALATRIVDISLENMPIGSMNIVNLQAYPIGIKIGNTSQMLKMFGHYKKSFNNPKGRLLTEVVNIFDLRNPKTPQQFYSTQFRFPKDSRSITYLTGLKKTQFEDVDRTQFISVSDRGPRS